VTETVTVLTSEYYRRLNQFVEANLAKMRWSYVLIKMEAHETPHDPGCLYLVVDPWWDGYVNFSVHRFGAYAYLDGTVERWEHTAPVFSVCGPGEDWKSAVADGHFVVTDFDSDGKDFRLALRAWRGETF
jgi:hypothetical protein